MFLIVYSYIIQYLSIYNINHHCLEVNKMMQFNSFAIGVAIKNRYTGIDEAIKMEYSLQLNYLLAQN